MQIYAEYLFIENFISGVVILAITAKICGLRINKKRICAGGLLCGLFSFSILLDVGSWLVGIAIKLAFSLFITEITFGILRTGSHGAQSRRSFVRAVTVFYIVSFLMGGVAIAVLYLGDIQGVTNNGFAYGGSVSYIKVYVAIAVTAYMGNIFAEFVRNRVAEEDMKRQVIVRIGENAFSFCGYVDSGNCLKDPVTGAQVAVISAGCAKTILQTMEKEEMERRYCSVPYRSAGVEIGLLDGVRTDSVTVLKSAGSQGEQNVKGMILAVYTGEFGIGTVNSEYQVLLNREAIEGGLV